MSSVHTTLDGEVRRTTRLAFLFAPKHGDEIWIPRSVAVDGDEITEGDTDVEVQTWFAEREGL